MPTGQIRRRGMRSEQPSKGTNVPEADAMDYIAGFLLFNNWSCRDVQRDESSVGLGPAKGKDCGSSWSPGL